MFNRNVFKKYSKQELRSMEQQDLRMLYDMFNSSCTFLILNGGEVSDLKLAQSQMKKIKQFIVADKPVLESIDFHTPLNF